jgi:hypothetical protein
MKNIPLGNPQHSQYCPQSCDPCPDGIRTWHRCSCGQPYDQAKAQAFADEMGIPKAYGSYEALLADPEIDAIYIPLPNHLHKPWTVRAAEAGKHILCEKPLALNVEECQEMIAAAKANGVQLMEAFMYRYHPRITGCAPDAARMALLAN